MKNFFTALFAIVCFHIYAQQITWAKDITNYSGNNVTTTYDNKGHVFVGGNFMDSVSIGGTMYYNQSTVSEMYFAKYDTAGNLMWHTVVHGKKSCYLSDIVADTAGNIYFNASCDDSLFCGAIKLFCNGFVYGKMNNSGVFQWVKTNTQGNSRGTGPAYIDQAGNFYITGQFGTDAGGNNIVEFDGTVQAFDSDPPKGSCDVWVLKMDPLGNALWARSGGNAGNDDYIKGVVVDKWGAVYITGYYNSGAVFDGISIPGIGSNDMFLVKYDVNGNCYWAKKEGGAQDDFPFDMAIGKQNDIYVTGSFKGSATFSPLAPIVSGGANPDAFTAKFDTSGSAVWVKKGGGASYDEAYAIAVSNNEVYISGIMNGTATFSGITLNTTNGTHFVAKYDYAGNILWAFNTGTGGSGVPNGMTSDPGRGVYVTGLYDGANTTFGTFTLPFIGTTTNSFTYKITDCPVAQLTPTGDSVYMCSTGGLVLSAPAGMTAYQWSTAATTQTISVSSTGYYSADVTYPGGCKAISNIVHVTNAPAPPAPDICMVTVDSASTYNYIYWDKTPYLMADSFIVYRETSTNTYKRIGAVSKDSLSVFVDTSRSVTPANGDPNITTYRYKLQVRDTCGTYSLKGPYHTSIHFSDQLNGSFQWNTYTVENMTVTPITTFELLRDSNNTGFWKVIGTASGTSNILIDPQYFTFQFVANWRVQANGLTCTPTMRYANNSTQGTVVRSKSNITNNRTTSVKNVLGKEVSIFPNPFSTRITVHTGMKAALTLYNTLGECVYKGQVTGDRAEIDLSDLGIGVYNLVVKTESGVTVKKIVKQ